MSITLSTLDAAICSHFPWLQALRDNQGQITGTTDGRQKRWMTAHLET